MNNPRTVALPEIAAATARMAGVDADTATRFIVELFARARAELAASDAPVLISGVGTFRRVAGIPGNVEFTPDEALAAAVNAPFSLFTPITLPDDTPDSIFDDEPAPIHTVPEAVPAPSADAPELPEVAEDMAEDITEETPIEIDTATEEIVAEPEPEATIEPAPATDNEHIHVENHEAPEPHPEPEIIYIARRSTWPWVAALIALVAGFAGGYCLGTRHSAAPVVTTVALTEVSPAEAASAPLDTAAAETDTIAAPADTTATDIAAEPQTTEVAKEPVYDTVSPSRFLTTIARDHYGRKDFWVFIYEANSDILKHPNRIRPGTRVLIPDLGPHAALDPSMRSRAHALASEIYRRYDMD
ncbi:MAG: hypothetical protein JFR38_08085 [Muribaculaceae bacterium]|nr:hypothetical protein [Muribaculaceae bacterium]